jgi:septum formation protein
MSKTNAIEIVLASASPRRKQLLEQMGIQVRVYPTTFFEDKPSDLNLTAHVRDMAWKKAIPAANTYPDSLVLAADTLVILGDIPLGKPTDATEAATMLRRLSSNWHQVITGFCLMRQNQHFQIIDHAMTDVHFYPLTAQEIDEYVSTGEPLDKAGAYGIQGLGAKFIQEIRGCYFNVVGLPVGLIWQYLKTLPEANP